MRRARPVLVSPSGGHRPAHLACAQAEFQEDAIPTLGRRASDHVHRPRHTHVPVRGKVVHIDPVGARPTTPGYLTRT